MRTRKNDDSNDDDGNKEDDNDDGDYDADDDEMPKTIGLMVACIQKKFTTVMMMTMAMMMPWMMMPKTIELMVACIQASWLLPS